ncbi:MAG: hypothetical protein LBR60_05290 [Fibrobacter sp.]|nr:hypothetical protein [Fibrobacter sp.]
MKNKPKEQTSEAPLHLASSLSVIEPDPREARGTPIRFSGLFISGPIFYVILMLRFFVLAFFALALAACDQINKGWVAEGGGYIKYSLNGEGSYELELLPESVQLPYVDRHYFYAQTAPSGRRDELAFMVSNPSLGKNAVVAAYTYFIRNGGLKAPLISGGSYVTFDQRDDSTWTADLNLIFESCSETECSAENPVRLSGRFRYWIPPVL